MTHYIGNALSLGMLDMEEGWARSLIVRRVGIDIARAWVEGHTPESCVGHADTADLLSALLGTPIAMRRVSTSLALGEQILVAQYTGPRLPEGATALPDGARIRWMHVTVDI